MYLKTRGLVLREVNYKEADKILTVLCSELGKRTVQARACRRKNSKLTAGAQLLVYSDMTLFERQDRLSLHEVSATVQFAALRTDVLLLSLASYMAECTEAVAQEGVPNAELLSLILNAIYALDALGKDPDLVKAAFELSLMCHSGFEPLLHVCAICGAQQPEQPRLHLRAGVLHCAACRASLEEGISMPLSPATLTVMRHIAWGDKKKLFSFRLDPVSMELLSNVTEAFLLTQLERGFRTLDFYKQLYRKETIHDRTL